MYPTISRARATTALALCLAASALLLPATAMADTTVGGKVTSESGGAELEGAQVVIIERNGAGSADDKAVGADVTDASGDFSIPVATGSEGEPTDGETVEIVVHDAGTQVESQSVALSGGTVVSNVSATPSGTAFAALDIFGGQVSRVLPGGAPCEFYLSTSVIPQVFVTTDCAGTWTPVTGQTDSSSLGLSGDSAINGSNMATSGVEGEIAVIVNGSVQYSRDFGTTWSTVSGTIAGPGNARELYWGHAGSVSVILLRDDTTTYTADLTSATPTLTQLSPTSYVTSANDGIAVANGYDKPYVVVAGEVDGTHSSTVTIYDLVAGAALGTQRGTFTAGSADWDTGRVVSVGFGGDTGTANGDMPNAIVLSVLRGMDSGAVNDTVYFALQRSAGGWGTAPETSSVASRDCGHAGRVGVGIARAFKPRASSGTAGAVVVGGCYALLSSTGSLLASNCSTLSGGNNAAIDPGWGTNAYDGGASVSRVLVAPQGDYGVQKATLVTADLPVWRSLDEYQVATAGIGNASDGFATTGLTVPVTKGMAFGPAGAADVAVIFSASGGGQCLASSDGLATAANSKTIIRKGGLSVDWFQGAGVNDWILCGHQDATNSLSGVRDWAPGTGVLGRTEQVASFGSTQHSLQQINTIDGVEGVDVAWLGGKTNGASTGKAVRATLGYNVVSSRVTATAAAIISLDKPVVDLEYCPAGSATGFGDVLFIATLDGATGSVYRLAGASTATTGASVTQLTGAGTTGAAAVEVNCATGVLYAGFKRVPSSPVIQKSTDGTSLTTVSLPGINFNQGVTAMAINPSSASELIFASDSEGFIYATVDGGSSWTTVNNARQFPGGVNFNSEGIAAMALPPGLTRSASAGLRATRQGEFHAKQQRLNALVGISSSAVSSSSTVVGGGSGAYRASFRSGLTGGSGGSGGPGGSGGSGGGGTPTPIAAPSGTGTKVATPTTRIAGARWSAAKRTITANVTVTKPGKVALTVSLKSGTKLTKITTGSATVKKAGTSLAVFVLKKKLAKGTYVLGIAGGGTTTLVVR